MSTMRSAISRLLGSARVTPPLPQRPLPRSAGLRGVGPVPLRVSPGAGARVQEDDGHGGQDQ